MSAASVHCHILGGDVPVVSDLGGKVTNVVCPQFSRVTFACEIKTDEMGIVSRVVGRFADYVAGTKNSTCEFAAPADSFSAQLAKKIAGSD